MNSILRVGVIGLGGAGLTHMKAFSKHPNTEVISIAGKEEERLSQIATEFGVKNTAFDWQDLVADTELDIISIATPNVLHYPITMAALESGKHVFCEKPLAITSKQTYEMFEVAKRNNCILEVALNYRRREDIIFGKELVSSGKLGRVYHSRASWKRRSGIPGIGSWFTSLEMAGGGAGIDLGPHLIDSLLYMLGEPKVATVSAVKHGELGIAGLGAMQLHGQMKGTGEFEVEDLCSALLRFEDGSSCQLEITWASHSKDSDDISFELLGVQSGLRISIANYASVNTLTIYEEIDGAPLTYSPEITSTTEGHLMVIQEFIDHVTQGQQDNHTILNVIHRATVLEAIYESAKSGQEVKL